MYICVVCVDSSLYEEQHACMYGVHVCNSSLFIFLLCIDKGSSSSSSSPCLYGASTVDRSIMNGRTRDRDDASHQFCENERRSATIHHFTSMFFG